MHAYWRRAPDTQCHRGFASPQRGALKLENALLQQLEFVSVVGRYDGLASMRMRHHGTILCCIAAAMGASKPVHQFELPERFIAVTHQINQFCAVVRRGAGFESLRCSQRSKKRQQGKHEGCCQCRNHPPSLGCTFDHDG